MFLAGCGKSISQRAGEKAAEKIIEKQSGGKADVDINKGNVKVETEQGKMEAGENVKLPSDFPQDVYVIEGAVKAVFSNQANGGYTISIETDKGLNEASAAYQEKFKSDGWKITGTMSFEDTASVTAEKDDRIASVIISKSDAKTAVTVSTGKK